MKNTTAMDETHLGIYAMTLKTEKIEKLKINNWPEGRYFLPHGMDVEFSSRQLYVINHDLLGRSERVEVFKVIENSEGVPISLDWLHGISSEKMTNLTFGTLNSIFVISPNNFYIT